MPVDTKATRKEILQTLQNGFNDSDVWGVAADWFEQQGPSLFVAIQEAVFRHSLVGVFSRLDYTLRGALLAIADEPDQHHSVTLLQATLNQETERACPDQRTHGPVYRKEDRLLTMTWVPNDSRYPLAKLKGLKMKNSLGVDGKIVCDLAV